MTAPAKPVTMSEYLESLQGAAVLKPGWEKTVARKLEALRDDPSA